MKISSILTGLAVSAIVFGGLASPVQAAIITVHQDDMQGWVFGVEGGATATAELVEDPQQGAQGKGSVAFSTPSNDDGIVIGIGKYQGTRLADINVLEYYTYRTSGVDGDAPAVALQFNIDADLTDADDSWQGRLVYEPYYTQEVRSNEWQRWRPMENWENPVTLNGNWWFSNAALAAETGCSQATPCIWDNLLALKPDIGIHNTFGGVIFKAGSGWAGFTGNLDAFSIRIGLDEQDSYDFELLPSDEDPGDPGEPPVVPLSKDACKKDGWISFADMFKNQGDCVSFVVSNEGGN